jgi:hypothetical protein
MSDWASQIEQEKSPAIPGRTGSEDAQVVEAFPWDTAPRFLLRDRDGVYGANFRQWVESMGVEESLEMDCPEPRSVQPPEVGEVLEVREAGGLYRHYERMAA